MVKRNGRKNKPGRSSASGHDRRRINRCPCETTVTLSLLGHLGALSRPVLVRAVDISTNGIAVITRQMILRGTVGALKIEIPGRRTAVVGVEAMNCEYVGEMNHRVGLMFTSLHNRFADDPEFSEGARTLRRSQAQRAFESSVR